MHVDTFWAMADAVAVGIIGVPAVITRPVPDDQSVETTVVWREHGRRMLAVPRSALSSLPKGTLIVAAERSGGTTKTWVVERLADPQEDLSPSFGAEIARRENVDPDAFWVFVKQQLGPVGGA